LTIAFPTSNHHDGSDHGLQYRAHHPGWRDHRIPGSDESEFGQVRSQGFAVDREESVNDGNCFGVPILAEGGEAAAAISMSIPKVRVRDSAHEAQVVEKLTEVARQIAAELYCLGRTSGRSLAH
jgi:DNA-binding IclR family transcriptional regulator